MGISSNNISSFLLDNKYRIYRHLLIQAVVVMITIGIFFDAPDKLNFSLNRFYGWISYFLFINMLVYVNAYILFPRFLAKNKMFFYIVSVILFTIFSIFVMIILQELFYDISVTQQQPWGIAVFLGIASSLLTIPLFLGGISSLLLTRQWMISHQRVSDLNLATSQSELKFLKSQINPHFLFNMLNNANILVDEEPDTASFILIKLNALLNYQLEDSLQDKVYLNADIHFLENYLELEKIRRDKFDYEISAKGNFDNVEVAPLLFIPFIENAVKHNSVTNPYVYISFKLQDNLLTFTCKNPISVTGSKRNKDGGLGLTNIKRRLDLLFNDKYILEQKEINREYLVLLQFPTI